MSANANTDAAISGDLARVLAYIDGLRHRVRALIRSKAKPLSKFLILRTPEAARF